MKGKKFLFFSILSALIVFSVMPLWAASNSWVAKGQSGLYYYSGNSEVNKVRIAAESSESDAKADNNAADNISKENTKDTSALQNMSATDRAAITELAITAPTDSSGTTDTFTSELLGDLLKNFTSLTTLSLSDIEFTSNASDNSSNSNGTAEVKLDLSVLPASVTTVSIAENPTITNVTLAGSNVTEFSAQGCENLTEIDIKGSKIQTLNIASTKITALDTEGCTTLENLSFAGCSMSEEDVKNLEQCTELKELDFGGNAFVKFSAAAFTKLTKLKASAQQARLDLAGSREFNLTRIFSAKVRTSEAVTTADDEDYVSKMSSITAKDADGNKLNGTPNGDVMEWDGEPATITYTYDTGASYSAVEEPMTVTIELSEGGDTVEGSGGGCNAGLATFALLAVGAFLLKRKY